VARTANVGTLSAAGIVKWVDDTYVWVDTPGAQVVTAGLTAANNLSEVVSKPTARANIGANQVLLSFRATDLAGTDATLYGICSPVAGTITKICWVLKGHALATGNATLTGKINGTAITTGLITITQAGSAIGNKGSVSPSALNIVAAGDEIQLLVGGTNDNGAAFAEISLLITT
jgi:alpha-tubulin suppressor-like RCC1 family protein